MLSDLGRDAGQAGGPAAKDAMLFEGGATVRCSASPEAPPRHPCRANQTGKDQDDESDLPLRRVRT